MKNLLKYIFLITFTFSLFESLLGQSDSEILVPYRKGNKWGYMSIKNVMLVKPQYQEAYPFIAGLASVKRKNKYGFINKSGEAVIGFRFDSAKDFYRGRALVGNDDSLFVINAENQEFKRVSACGGGIMHMLDYGVMEMNGLIGVVRAYPYDTIIHPKYIDVKVFSDIDIFAVMDTTNK